MKLLSFTACALTGIVLAGCGSAAPLTASGVQQKLEQAGITCGDIKTEPSDDEEIPATVVTCTLGSADADGAAGGVIVIVADTADDFAKARAKVCSDPAALGDVPDAIQWAFGDTWLGLAISTSGVGASQVAEALDGRTGSLADFCL